jgi:hypothetical protein
MAATSKPPTRTVPAKKETQIELPTGQKIWVKNPSANKRQSQGREFLYLVNGDEVVIQEAAAK